MRLLPCVVLVLAACHREPDDSDVPPEDTDVPVDTDDTDVDDGACGEPDVSPQSVTVDDTCASTFATTVLWRTDAIDGSLTTPLVAQLTDDDGDGAITSADTPDIVHTGYSTGQIYAIDGADGSVHWTAGDVGYGGGGMMTPAIGDLDGDGFPEVVLTGTDAMKAFRGTDGSTYWTAPPYVSWGYAYGAVGIWDLDGDGFPEVVVGYEIRDGRTGALVGTGAHGEGTDGGAGPISIAADIDQDGDQEVVTGNALYDRSGATLWFNGQPDGYPAVAQFDADPYGEIVVSGKGKVRLQDDDGEVLWSKTLGTSSRSGPPTIADLDGDGEPEIAVSGIGMFAVLEADGSTKWSMAITDARASGFLGSSAFDFEGDGALELLFADEEDLYVVDGATGAVKLKEERHVSPTAAEYPVVADVDDDGHADIVYASENYGWDPAALTVLTDARHAWQPARPVWNQYAYHITNVEDDGGIPAVPDSNWLTSNTYRAGNLSLATEAPADTDAVLLLNEVCALDCDDGVLRVTVVVGNAGTGEIPAGLAVSAWADGALLATQTVAAAIASGTSSEGLAFALDAAAVGDGPLEFRADEAGALAECDEEDNVLVVDAGLCP